MYKKHYFLCPITLQAQRYLTSILGFSYRNLLTMNKHNAPTPVIIYIISMHVLDTIAYLIS